jgi:exodeoxyribonuclease V beta subunit
MAAADEADLEELHAKLHRWAALLRSRGVAALLDSISATEAVPRRVLARVGGERRLTDLGHVGQLLHIAATEQQLGVASLTAWLRQRIADAGRDSAGEDRALRLDSDAEAVQVLTIHRSKGLEFPIVYHPFAWQPRYIDQDRPPAYHDDRTTTSGRSTSAARPRHRPAPPLRDHEQRGEDLRLLYVALTRTMHQATVWWAGAWQCHNSSLGVSSSRATPTASSPRRGHTRRRRGRGTPRGTRRRAPGRIAVEGRGSPARAGASRTAAELDASTFGALDARWRRVSSAASSPAREEPGRTSPTRRRRRRTASTQRRPTAPRRRRGAAPASAGPLATCPAAPTSATSSIAPGGDRFRERRPRRRTRARLAEQRRRRTSTSATPTRDRGLIGAIETPLGPLLDELRLRDVAPADRLDELASSCRSSAATRRRARSP